MLITAWSTLVVSSDTSSSSAIPISVIVRCTDHVSTHLTACTCLDALDANFPTIWWQSWKKKNTRSQHDEFRRRRRIFTVYAETGWDDRPNRTHDSEQPRRPPRLVHEQHCPRVTHRSGFARRPGRRRLVANEHRRKYAQPVVAPHCYGTKEERGKLVAADVKSYSTRRETAPRETHPTYASGRVCSECRSRSRQSNS